MHGRSIRRDQNDCGLITMTTFFPHSTLSRASSADYFRSRASDAPIQRASVYFGNYSGASIAPSRTHQMRSHIVDLVFRCLSNFMYPQ